MSEFTFKLTDNEWNKIEQYLPTNNLGRNPKYTNREILDCIIYIIKVGCQWRTLTKTFKIPWQTIYYRFNTWKHQNINKGKVKDLQTGSKALNKKTKFYLHAGKIAQVKIFKLKHKKFRPSYERTFTLFLKDVQTTNKVA